LADPNTPSDPKYKKQIRIFVLDYLIIAWEIAIFAASFILGYCIAMYRKPRLELSGKNLAEISQQLEKHNYALCQPYAKPTLISATFMDEITTAIAKKLKEKPKPKPKPKPKTKTVSKPDGKS
jgi:hypothetical protein